MPSNVIIIFRAHDWKTDNGRFVGSNPRPIPPPMAARPSPQAASQRHLENRKIQEQAAPPAVTERKPVQPTTFSGKLAALMTTGLSYQQAIERLQDGEATA